MLMNDDNLDKSGEAAHQTLNKQEDRLSETWSKILCKVIQVDSGVLFYFSLDKN